MSMVRGLVSRFVRGGRGSAGGPTGGPHATPTRGGAAGGGHGKDAAIGRGVRTLLRRFR